MPATLIGNTITESNLNIYTNKSLDAIWDEQINVVRDDIQHSITDDTLRRNMLLELNNIDAHLQANISILQPLVLQVNCEITKNDSAHAITIDRIIHFCIVGKLVDNHALLPKEDSNKSIIGERDYWLFNAAKTSPLSLGTHIGAIADFIASRNSCEISNGSAFICQLLNNGSLNCDHCLNGELNIQSKLSKILPNFFNSKRGVAINDEARKNDFFELEKQHQIQFKCGNCVTNLFDLANAKKILN